MVQTPLSPAIITNEFDLTGIVTSVSTTDCAFSGIFRWGPVEKVVMISSEGLLAHRFGTPTNLNPETWFTAASFLAYGNRLHLVRAADTTGNTKPKSFDGNSTNFAIAGDGTFLQCNNTTDLAASMLLFYSNNAALPVGARIISVNSTGVVLSDSASANVEDVEVIFRDRITFTAGALQSDLDYDETDVADWDNLVVKNDDHYTSREAEGDTFDVAALYVARYPGEIGNSLRVSVCDTYNQFKSNTSLHTNSSINAAASLIQGNVGSNVLSVTVTPAATTNGAQSAVANATAGSLHASLSVGDLIEVGNTRLGLQFLKVTALGTVTNTANVYSFTITCDDELKLAANAQNNNLVRYWEFYNSVETPPEQSDWVLANGNTSANDELHVVVVDEDGKFSGSPGTILETYRNLSRATDARTDEGLTNYYKDVINQKSEYIWWANDRTTAVSNTAALITSSTASKPLNMNLIGGVDGYDEINVPLATLTFGYDFFRSQEDLADIALVLQGKARGDAVSHYTQLGNYIVDQITEARKDCVAFLSPHLDDVVFNRHEEVNDTVEWITACRDSSYYVADSGYKYMYDRYNDVYRWVPLNGDIAGLCVRTDATTDPWFSPAGINRGQLKNVIRLAWNPRQAERDTLFKNNINPVIQKQGSGFVLYGDKTGLKKQSAFDAIGVRRMFIVLRKSIARASEAQMFEFNDAFTQASFKNMVTPYLREVQGRRGIQEFVVVCDDSNNTPQVIDANQFVGDIYIKPARSIRWMILNFIAVPTGVTFSEVIRTF